MTTKIENQLETIQEELKVMKGKLTYLQNLSDRMFYLILEILLEKDPNWSMAKLRELSANGMEEEQKEVLDALDSIISKEIATRKVRKHSRKKAN
ncbi:hypothetical protein [Enterococcus cecorum]|uniref:hypothetical protein n=1 Tax=Enterococcus cecorum TaxID=44008 RepID=UPI001FABCDA1|nr:hypothetical protein [Enterococcus cecorum]MCJ0538772.1 hypothetical protein [Enterococcus cecorum]MCJ0547149.1 hypothetical protein [Enterococcus cecorum]MCJ0551864.1 hypothetical protein [Enterococcus cecorum]MCJ0570018.1 hypothetical protein [Enterococcus cecorum]